VRRTARGVRAGGRLPVTHAGHPAQDDFYPVAGNRWHNSKSNCFPSGRPLAYARSDGYKEHMTAFESGAGCNGVHGFKQYPEISIIRLPA
jgi:hypothetical protein